METEIFQAIQDISLESLIISFFIFLITEIIKMPIKKGTAKLTEEKRKAVNLLIILIPVILSCIACVCYYGITKKVWFSWEMLQMAFSSWVLSLSFYAIYSRVVIIIKGVISGKIKLTDQLTKEAIASIKDEVKTISSKLKTDNKSIKAIQEKIEAATKTKNILEEGVGGLDISRLSQTNVMLKSLEDEKAKLTGSVQVAESEKSNFLKILNGGK